MLWGEYAVPWRAYILALYNIAERDNADDRLTVLADRLKRTHPYQIVRIFGIGEALKLTKSSRQPRYAGVQKRPLVSLLRTFASAECQVEHDRVYALLSLAEEGHRISIDYEVPITTVYQQVVRSSRDALIDVELMLKYELRSVAELFPRSLHS